MNYTLIVKNGNLLFIRYKDLSLIELALYLWHFVVYYNNNFKEDELSEMIFRTLNQPFMKKYCKHFANQNAGDAQIFLRHLFWDK